MRILAVETSCDETAASVLEARSGAGPRILSNVVYTQTIHSRHGGVVPELAGREHLEKINDVVSAALEKSRTQAAALGAVAYTALPGLAGSLLVGRTAAETLAWFYGKKIIPVDHIEAHAASAALSHPRLKPPFLSLVVSGGHTDLLVVESFLKFRRLGGTRDDAAGEAFDKVAKMLGLEYPGGPRIEKLAAAGNPSAVNFPRPFMRSTWDFSFSGVKTSVLYHLRALCPSGDFSRLSLKTKADIAASFQAAVVETLADKLARAAEFTGMKNLALGGGVALNRSLRKAAAAAARRVGGKIFLPAPEYCADNAAMIALAAYYKIKLAQAGGRG